MQLKKTLICIYIELFFFQKDLINYLRLILYIKPNTETLLNHKKLVKIILDD